LRFNKYSPDVDIRAYVNYGAFSEMNGFINHNEIVVESATCVDPDGNGSDNDETYSWYSTI
jgi:hypothetical protein